jgi:hypothetical protein
MKITEIDPDVSEAYSCELRERVKAVYLASLRISKLKKLLAQLKKESAELRNLFWTEDEKRRLHESVSFFDARMQAMAFYTLKNMENYEHSGWKELIYDRELDDEA